MTEVSGKSRKEPRPNDFSYKFSPPQLTASQLQEIARAASACAERNPSDPFAYGRIHLHMSRGIANVAEVMADVRGVGGAS